MYTVKQVRLLKDLTQEEMAKLMGMHRDTYRRLEAHPEKATIFQAKKICEITGYSIDDIFLLNNSTLSRLKGMEIFDFNQSKSVKYIRG